MMKSSETKTKKKDTQRAKKRRRRLEKKRRKEEPKQESAGWQRLWELRKERKKPFEVTLARYQLVSAWPTPKSPKSENHKRASFVNS